MADLRDVVTRLGDAAKDGDVSAAKLLFDRLLGPPVPLDIEERLKALEERLSQKQNGSSEPVSFRMAKPTRMNRTGEFKFSLND